MFNFNYGLKLVKKGRGEGGEPGADIGYRSGMGVIGPYDGHFTRIEKLD